VFGLSLIVNVSWIHGGLLKWVYAINFLFCKLNYIA